MNSSGYRAVSCTQVYNNLYWQVDSYSTFTNGNLTVYMSRTGKQWRQGTKWFWGSVHMENNLRILYLLLIYQMHWLVAYRTADIFNWVELVLCPLKTLVDALKQKTPKAKIKKCLFLTDFILTFIEYICLYLYVLMFSNMYEADAYWNILLLPRHIALIEHMESGSPDGTSLLSGRHIILQMYGQLWARD